MQLLELFIGIWQRRVEKITIDLLLIAERSFSTYAPICFELI